MNPSQPDLKSQITLKKRQRKAKRIEMDEKGRRSNWKLGEKKYEGSLPIRLGIESNPEDNRHHLQQINISSASLQLLNGCLNDCNEPNQFLSSPEIYNSSVIKVVGQLGGILWIFLLFVGVCGMSAVSCSTRLDTEESNKFSRYISATSFSAATNGSNQSGANRF